MIELRFEKLSKEDRLDEVCHVAIPCAEGKLLNKEQFIVKNELGELLTIQSDVLSLWQDGTIKWLSVYFRCDLQGNKATVVYGDFVETPQIEEQPKLNPITVDFTKKEGIYVSYLEESRGIEQYIRLKHHMTDSHGTNYIAEMEQEEIRLLLKGPVRMQWQVKGRHKSTTSTKALLPFEFKVTLDAGKPWFQVDYRIINETSEDIELHSLVADIENVSPELDIRKALATSNYLSNIQLAHKGQDISCQIDADYLLKEANEHIPETFYGTFWGDWYDEKHTFGICATHFQAYQNFPKGIVVNDAGILLEMLPVMEEPLILKAGMAKTHTYFVQLHTNETLEALNIRSLHFQMVDRPMLNQSVYKQAGVLEGIFSDLQDFDFDQRMVDGADKRSRGFGILNWGDAPDMGYTNQGRGNGKLVWTNNEYDFPHAALLLYTKTGIRRMLDYCLVSARHQMDVDVCHAPGLGLRYLGQIEHSNDHTQGEVKPCHQWVEGLLDYYHLTGDTAGLNAALGIGKNILKLLELERYAQSGGINARETGWAMRTLIGLYKETYDEKWLVPTQKIISQFTEWRDTYGGWLSPYTDHTVIRVPFMIAIAVGSLMRYYQIRPDGALRALILDAVDDLCANCQLPNGTFYYKELPSLQWPSYNSLVLEALSYAFELTGDVKYLKAGIKTFEKGGQDASVSTGKRKIDTFTVVTGGQGPKVFAQSYHALTLFHKHSLETGLI